MAEHEGRDRDDNQSGSAQHQLARAGYQGQPGSFGARAAVRYGEPIAFPTFERALRALADGTIEVALLPAVTVAAGAIPEPLDALAEAVLAGASLAVVGEIAVPVKLVLALPRGPRGTIDEVWSQAPALRQCRQVLARLDAVPIETTDTASAAARVAELGGARAAVCSEEAALDAGLVIVEEDVSDIRPNATRFWRVERLDRQARAVAERSERADGDWPRRVVFYSDPRATVVLAEVGAEILALPGRTDAAVRGFAIIDEKQLPAIVHARTGALRWLGLPPEVPRPPRVKALPRATEVREPSVVEIGPFAVGGGRRAIIAGPCAVESPEQIERIARLVVRAGATALRGGVFKPRTSPYSFQGHGWAGLEWLRAAGDAVGVPVITEVMAPDQVGRIAERADMLQIGARNCQNYDLLKEAGRSGRPVLLKRGFGTTVDDWLASAEYLLAAGCRDVMLCERGIRTFENATRSTLDLCGLLAARSLTHLPILADPSHAAGRRDLVPGLARAAWGADVDGLIIEVHDQPETALSDGPQSLFPADLEVLIDEFGLAIGPGDSVERVRRAIDAGDRAIAALVGRRLDLCRSVAAVKRASGAAIRDHEREASVRDRFAKLLGADTTIGERLADALIALGLEVEGWQEEATS
jgi:3-deoxy-7-phosphoheptulonate synthase